MDTQNKCSEILLTESIYDIISVLFLIPNVSGEQVIAGNIKDCNCSEPISTTCSNLLGFEQLQDYHSQEGSRK
jgi:hypothetical protein